MCKLIIVGVKASALLICTFLIINFSRKCESDHGEERRGDDVDDVMYPLPSEKNGGEESGGGQKIFQPFIGNDGNEDDDVGDVAGEK